MRIVSFVLALVTQVLPLAAHAAEEPFKVLELRPSVNWEKMKSNERAIKYYGKAEELKALGKYTDATYFFNLAAQQDPDFKSNVNWEQAEIFDHLGRKEDADKLMRMAIEGKRHDFWFTEKYVRYLIKEHRGNEAVAVCHKIPYLLKWEEGVVLLAESFIASGRKPDAIALAKHYYTRMEREETTNGALKAFLEKNGVRCDFKYSSRHNRAVLSTIKRISSLNKPVTDSQLAALFPQQDKDKKWLRYNSGARCTICRSNFWQIRIFDEEPNSSRIKIYPNRHKTCITRAEVEKLFGKTVMKPATWAMHGNGRPERFEYFDRDPNLRFFFSSTRTMFPPTNEKIQRVTEVQIAWKAGRIPERPPTPYEPPKPVPDDEIEAHVQEAEKAYQDGDIRRAITLAMKYFQEGHNTKATGYDRYVRRKKLLIDCYSKLGRNEIVEVLKVADYATIAFYVEQAFGYKTLLMPTIDEYLKERWRAIGGYDGEISFLSTGWLTTGVQKDNPHYDEFLKLIGSLKDGEERLVPPVPARLIDPTLFDPGVI